jgi:hypothetical protein
MKGIGQKILVPFLAVVVACHPENRGTSMPSTSEIIHIANHEAIRLGFDLRDSNVTIDEQNSEWESFQAATNILDTESDLANLLRGKEYWAVYYWPRERPGVIFAGGKLFVFIDKKTRKSIGHVILQ